MEENMTDLEARYKRLSEQREICLRNKIRITTVLETRRKELKDAIAACKAAGYHPDNLEADLAQAREVLIVKLDALEADLNAANEVMKPMLREIDGRSDAEV
jgi:hypothetical protein